MRGLGAGTRIFELLDRQPLISHSAGVPIDPIRRGVLKFENITFEYPTRKGEILKNLDLDIAVGGNIAVV